MIRKAYAANVAAAIVILLAGALSAFWAFLVPIFQAPDEPAHFDYAISIYNARRMVRLADGKPDWIVSPYTRYLMHAADFDRIMGHSSMRVPPHYGSRDYYARIAAAAPSLYKPTTPSGRVSYIVGTYPFAFYALEAIEMRAASFFTGSIVAVFFGARLLCVFLLMVGLYFNYRTAINLGMPHWTAVALIGAIGFFPLTSLVSSYIQPDNLAYALVSASLFFGTELRDGTLPLRVVVPLGITLGLLGVTKYQFFISTAVAIALLFAVRFARERSNGLARLAAVAALLAPAVALLAVQHFIVGFAGTTERAQDPAGGLFEPFIGALAGGVASAARYTIATSGAAFTDLFLFGPCAATYWQVIGWVDTPIVIVNASAEAWIRLAIAMCTGSVIVILAFQFSRNASRLLRAVKGGRRYAALAIAAGDPVLNSYIVIIATLFSLYVVSNNAYGAEGRHWYPYIFAAFLCFVWYAPRALRKRHHGVSAMLAMLLLAYAILAAVFAVLDLRERYYAPQTARYVATAPQPWEISSRRAVGALRPLQSARYHVNRTEFPFSYPAGSRVLVTGAVMPDPRTGAAPVAVVLDQRTPIPVLFGQYDFRIGEALHSTSAGYSGFSATIATAGLAEGPHIVEAYAKASEGTHYLPIAPTRIFFVTAPDGMFSGTAQRVLERAPLVDGRLAIAGTCRGLSSVSLGVDDVASGAVLLLTGTLPALSGAPYAGAWLTVSGRPYPARYDATAHALAGAVPTAGAPTGAHRVYAYVIHARTLAAGRLSQSATFEVTSSSGGRAFLKDPPRPCADPLSELAGT